MKYVVRDGAHADHVRKATSNEREMRLKQARGELWMFVIVVVCRMSESAQQSGVQQLVGESPTTLTSPQLAPIAKWKERLVHSSEEVELPQIERYLRAQNVSEDSHNEKRRRSQQGFVSEGSLKTTSGPHEASSFLKIGRNYWQGSSSTTTQPNFPVDAHNVSKNINSGNLKEALQSSESTPHPCHRGRHSHSFSTECPSTTTDDTQLINERENDFPLNTLEQDESPTTKSGLESSSIKNVISTLPISTEDGLLYSSSTYGLRTHLRRRKPFTFTSSSSPSSSLPISDKIYLRQEDLSRSSLHSSTQSSNQMESFNHDEYDLSITTSVRRRNYHDTSRPSFIVRSKWEEAKKDSSSSSPETVNDTFNKIFRSTLFSTGTTSSDSFKNKEEHDHLMNYSVGKSSSTVMDDNASQNGTTTTSPWNYHSSTTDIYSSYSSSSLPLENTRNNDNLESTSNMGMNLTSQSTSKEEERKQERSQLERRFKQTHPISLWRAVGFFDDEFLESIDSHWLQFGTSSVVLHRVLGILYGVLMVIGCGGNLLVILMFIRCRSLRTPPNYLIVNLAVSDFLMMVKMPIFIFNSIYSGPALGSIGCKVYGFLGGLSGTASIMTLAAIAVDRYTVIVFPLNPMKRTTSARALLMALGVWVYSFVFSSLPLLGVNGYVPEGLLTSCSFDYLSPDTKDRIFVFVFFLAAFVVPLTLIVNSYARIFRTVRSAERLEMFNPPQSKNGMPLTRESFKYKQEGKKQKTEVKIAVLSMTIIVIWLLAWTPYATIALMGIFGYKRFITPFVSAVPALFCKSAACVNPFIYAINHPRFQRELRAKLPTFLTRIKRASSPDESFYSNASATYHEEPNVLMSKRKSSSLKSPTDEKQREKKNDNESSSSSPVSITFNLPGSPRGVSGILRKTESHLRKGSHLKSLLNDFKQENSKAKSYLSGASTFQHERETFNDMQKPNTHYRVPEKIRFIEQDAKTNSTSFSGIREEVKGECDTARNFSALIGESKFDLIEGSCETKTLLEDSTMVHDDEVRNPIANNNSGSCEFGRKLGLESDAMKSIKISDSQKPLSCDDLNPTVSRISYETTIL